MGQRASNTATITFTDCRVPAANLLVQTFLPSFASTASRPACEPFTISPASLSASTTIKNAADDSTVEEAFEAYLAGRRVHLSSTLLPRARCTMVVPLKPGRRVSMRVMV